MSDEVRRSAARPPRQPATRAVRAGIATDLHHGAVVPPIHLSSTFAFEGFGKKRLYDYTRTGNPTREYLANALAELENGEGGVVTSTGMSAVALVLQLVRPDDLRDTSRLSLSTSPARPLRKQLHRADRSCSGSKLRVIRC